MYTICHYYKINRWFRSGFLIGLGIGLITSGIGLITCELYL